MAGAFPYIGCKISLLSKHGIRYEGTLYTIDPNDSTIALSNGQSAPHLANTPPWALGRPTAGPIPARRLWCRQGRSIPEPAQLATWGVASAAGQPGVLADSGLACSALLRDRGPPGQG